MKELEERIIETDKAARQATGRANDNVVDQHVELAHISCFQEAARSMAAVAMIAPFIESLFQAVFVAINEPSRRRRGISVVDRIIQVVERTGMKEYMPEGFESTLSALFKYRNKIFHGGFEWSQGRMKDFQKALVKEHWPSGFFSCTKAGGYPWMFYMTPAFIDHCFTI